MPKMLDFLRPDSHAGLLYESRAPVGLDDGKIPDAEKRPWLEAVSAIRIPHDYPDWFKHRWRKWLEQECFVAELTATSRLLVGSGIASATEVGLQLHHTWGVPMVPGSSLKGVLSHYLHAVYGPDLEHDEISPCDPAHPQPEQARFRRPRLAKHKPSFPPGDWQRIICGTAEYDDVRAAAGHVVFHDMLLVPQAQGEHGLMLSVDVLTPHHSGYYMKGHAANDYESPVPVPFLAVPPGVKFLLAVGGDRAWAKFAAEQVCDAVRDWGLGAKTAAGYGRLEPDSDLIAPRAVSAASRGLKEEVAEWARQHAPGNTLFAAWEAFIQSFCKAFGERLKGVSDEEERKKVTQPVNTLIANKNLKLSNKEKAALREKLAGL